MKTKNGTRAMATAKNKVFIGLLLENCYLVREMTFWWGKGGIKIWSGGSLTWREFFLVGGGGGG